MFHRAFPSFRREKIFVSSTVVAEGAADYALVSAVVDWANMMLNQGAYHASEMAEEAPYVYYADYYFAQVRNGGHAQFRHNSRMHESDLRNAQAGLKAAGLTDLLSCLEALIAAPEMGEKEIKALDDRFFAAYGAYYENMNAWIRTFVKIMPEARYERHLAKVLTHDATRAQRVRDRDAYALKNLAENHDTYAYSKLLGDLGFTLWQVRPGRFDDFLGEQTVIWDLEYHDGTKVGHLSGMLAAETGFFVMKDLPDRSLETDEYMETLGRTSKLILMDDVKKEVAHACDIDLGITVYHLLEVTDRLAPKDITAIHLVEFGKRLEKGDYARIHTRDEHGQFYVKIDNRKAQMIDVEKKVVIAELSRAHLKKANRQLEARSRVH